MKCKYFFKNNLAKLTQEKAEHLNTPLANKEIVSAIIIQPSCTRTHTHSHPNDFTNEFF